MKRVFIAFGSNVGDRLGTMRTALKMLEECDAVEFVASSPVYSNRAIGVGDAEPFLNAVLEFATEMEPEALLELCLKIETALGRVPSSHWISRTIDLDLLFYEGIRQTNERLTLPHPRIEERDFVAQPLCDLDADLEVNGQTLKQIVEALPSIELELFAEQI